MRLHAAEIDRYGPLAGCRPPCGDLTIVAGPNESGKTLYLEAVLQLLEPDVTDHLEPGPRVEGQPTGRIVLDDGADHHALGDGTALSDVSRVEASHLYNLFVIRDSDLALPDGSAYYTSLVEHLGDVHTSEIGAIRAELVDEGRLTASRLNLADRDYDTKTVRADAEALADEVEAYLDIAAEEGIDELARERLQVGSELRTVEAGLDAQRTAREHVAIEDAAAQLAIYRTATETLRNAAVDRSTLETLRERDRDRTHAQHRIDEVESTLESNREELERHRDDLTAARDRHERRSQRRSDVARVESELEAYRDRTGDLAADGGDALASRLAQRRTATIGGLVGAGLAGAASAVTGFLPAAALAFVLALVGIVAAWSHRRLTSRAAAADAMERDLLRTARDAGFEVESVAEVPARVRNYRDELEAAETRVRDLETRVDRTTERLDELEARRREAVEERRALADDIEGTLTAAGVDSIGDYEARVEAVEAERRRRSEAATILSRELGEPDADRPSEKCAAWESALADWRAEVGPTDVVADAESTDGTADANVGPTDGTAGADVYDEAKLERLERRQRDLSARLSAVTDALEDFEAQLDAFERRAAELSPPPFVETSPSLEARTIDGLADLAASLRTVADEIEANADRSRKAIGILDAIEADEQRKVATLFDPDGPASKTLAHLTDGRYSAVEYDPDAGSLEVRAADGATFTPHQLSKGTRDQLYFAARLSLAKQLLGGSAGFLLLDDPFLAADRDRLRNGFETLRDLVADGWQILYLTAKREVRETMAAEFGCSVYEMDPLEG